MEVAEQLKEIFKTPNGCVYQSDNKGCFELDFAGYMTTYKFPCFFALKRLVDRIDLDAMAFDTSTASDLEIISPCGSDRCYCLTFCQVLEFKELLAGTYVMLQLNSIIHERLFRVAV